MNEFENIPLKETSKQEKLYILEELSQSESFNVFLNDKLKTSKRFGVEGLDSMISGLSKIYVTKINQFRRQQKPASSTLAWEWLIEEGLMLWRTSLINHQLKYLQNFKKTSTSRPGEILAMLSITQVQLLKNKLLEK